MAGENTDQTGALDAFTDYFYAGVQVVETRDATSMTSAPSATPHYQYVWSARYVDSPILRDTYSSGVLVSGSRLYYTSDANHNVTSLVNASGVVVERLVHGLRRGDGLRRHLGHANDGVQQHDPFRRHGPRPG